MSLRPNLSCAEVALFSVKPLIGFFQAVKLG
nr:MAG TPA: hypothetical protein [Caudoviricetes sp.]